MKFFNFGSINRRLTLLVTLSILPALAILLYSDIEQRRHLIEDAKKDLSLLTRSMAAEQQKTIISARQILSTLALIPEIQELNIQRSRENLASVRRHNSQYIYMVLIDLAGNPLAASGSFVPAGMATRKHFKDALVRKKFAVGEFIIPEAGAKTPVFPFAYPILDKSGRPKAILSTGISVTGFSTADLVAAMPEKSFLAVTDHRGISLYYHPSQQPTNPIGRPINAKNWEIADRQREPGIFMSRGSDGINRIFAFEPLRLSADDAPYMYVWAGIPEAHISAHANLSNPSTISFRPASGTDIKGFFTRWR